MLIAFNFPEAEYNKLYSIVNKILLKNEISNKVQWPHISLLEVPDVKEEDKKEIQEQLKNKPVFKAHGFDVFEGRDRDYLVITLDTPKEYKEAFSYLNNKFKTNKEIRTPHVSLLSVPKKDNEVLLKLMPEISKQTINTMPEQVKPNYIQFWRKADPTMVIDHDPSEDKSFEVFDVMESQFELNELEEKTLYHGTDETFSKFQLMPAKTGHGWGKGIYLTSKGKEASRYAGSHQDSQVHIVDIDLDKVKLANIYDPKIIEILDDEYGMDTAIEYPDKKDMLSIGDSMSTILRYSLNDIEDSETAKNDVRKVLMKNGYDGLYIPVHPELEKEHPDLGDTYVIYKPELVKHLYVKEDTEKAISDIKSLVDYLFKDEKPIKHVVAKEGGVIVNHKLTPDAYKAKKLTTIQIKELELSKTKAIIDVRKEKANDISHIFALQYSPEAWHKHVLFPETSEKIVHIGAFKNSDCAMNYLRGKTGMHEDVQLFEKDWAHEVGQVKAELGEIEEIYKDFDAIFNRILDIEDVLDREHITKLIRSMERIRLNLIRAENSFRSITNSAKAPNRNPIKHSTPVADPKKEMQRISTDIAKLSVRVRNIGQSVDDFENVPTSDVAETFEKASEALRKIFVQFEKLIPENFELSSNLLEAEESTLDLTNFADALQWAEKNVPDAFSDSEEYIESVIHERIRDYIYKYKQVTSKPTITLYRAIVLKKDMSNLNLKNIGSHWSFEEKGAGSYGLNRAMRKDETEFTFTGVAQTKDIDWEYGFTSFLYYGEEQWECALNPGAKVTLTHVDKKALPKPMIGVVGSKLMGEDFKNINDLKEEKSNPIIAYHGGNSPINKFDKNFSAQGVFWFSDNKDKILKGESGAASTKYLMTVELNVKNPAGWKEYERDSLDRIEQDGFDSIKLDDDWIVFDSKKIKVIKAEKVEDLKESDLEEAKKKLKKIKKMLAPFYGRGNGVSGATMPPFRTNMSNTKLGPSLPGPTGQNAPQFGTLPAGPTAPMVSSKDWDEFSDKLLREWNNNK